MQMVLRILNTVFFVSMIVINALANILSMGGNTTGSVSNKYPNLFTPSPITFLIWGIIYIFVGLFVVYQFIPVDGSVWIQEAIQYWFIISCIGNMAWLFLWHYGKIELSMIAMLLLLAALIVININLGRVETITIWDRLTVYGFNIYLGWICVATIANISVVLVRNNWNRFGIAEEVWTVAILLVGTVIGICFTLVGERIYSTAAIMWAYAGIALRYFQQGSSKTYPLIVTITILSILLMALVMVCMFVKKKTFS